MSYDLAYCNRIQASKVSCIMASLIQPTDKVASLEPDLEHIQQGRVSVNSPGLDKSGHGVALSML